MMERLMKRKILYRILICVILISFFSIIILPGNTYGATITSTIPRDGEEDIPVDSWIIIRFNDTMKTETVEENLKISPSLKPYRYRLEWSDNDRELTIKPNAALSYDEEYTISFSGAKDENGNEVDITSFSYKTESAPTISEIIIGMFLGMWAWIISIIPNLIIFIVILIIGYIVAKAAAWVFSKALRRLGFDKAMDRVGVLAQLNTIGIKSASRFLGIFVFWFIFVIVLQIAISWFGVPEITNILAPIVLFIPRILIAAIIILVGLFVANVIANKLLEHIGKTEIGKQLLSVDRKTKTSGISVISIVSLFIKIFILLFFVQIALEIVNIGLLAEFITPVLLILPLVLLALFIILIGLIVTEIIRKAILKIIQQFQIWKLVRPVEETIGRSGVIVNVFIFVVRVIVMLIFIQLAISVLNATGAFDQLQQLINVVILWMPNILAAIIIILIGFWVAGWVQKKILTSSKQMDIPFPETAASAMKYLIIYLAGVMAIAQIGFEVPILYIVTAIVLGAVFIGLGAGFAVGSKEIFANIGGYFQNNKVLKIGKRVTIDGKYTGTVNKIERFTTTIVADNGEKIIIPNSQLIKSVIFESPART